MKHKLVYLIALVVLAPVVLGGCRTTEANYRAAYERATAYRDSSESLDSTIYGRYRREMNVRPVALPGGGSIDVYTQHVRVTDEGGGIPENLHRYSVVVGRFKQKFNAVSMRNRLADGGFPGAFVVQTAEPYYFVLIGSYRELPEAVAAMNAIPEGKIHMKAPLPMILDATRRVR